MKMKLKLDKPISEIPVWKRLAIGAPIAAIVSFGIWMVVALMLNVVFRFVWSNSTIWSTWGFYTWLITFIAMEFTLLYFAWWNRMDIDKALKTSNYDPKEYLKSPKAFNKLGFVGILGEPHKSPGIVIGTRSKKDTLLDKKSNYEMEVAVEETYHTALLGPTGTGKSQIYNAPSIIHNLATEDDVDSDGNIKKRIAPTMLVVDVKGELFDKTSSFAKAKGYKIHCLDTNKGTESLAYNPLFEIHNYWIKGRQKDKKAPANLQIAKEMIENTVSIVLEVDSNQKADAFWKNGEVRMLSGLIGLMFDMYEYGVLSKDQVSFATAYEISTNIKSMVEYGNEYGVNELYMLYLKDTIKALEADPDNKMQSGIVTGMQGKIKTFNIYKDITSRDDFHLINDSDKNIIYLKVPDHEPASYKIASLFISQYYITQVNKANDHSSKKAIRDIKIIWDELANFPVVPTLPMMTRMGRSRGFQFFFSLQDRASLESRYGKIEAETIFKQCLAKIALKVDENDAKFFSSLVGERPKKRNKSFNSERQGISTSISEDTKNILRPDEIQDFEIISASENEISESITITPRSKALIKNVGFFKVEDHICGGYEKFEFDVVETYYNKGTKIWDETYKSNLREADNKKKQWDSTSWRKEFEAKWKIKNAPLSKEPNFIDMMKEATKKARKEFLEKNGMIVKPSDIKKQVQEEILKIGEFSISNATKKTTPQISEAEMIGYSTILKDKIREMAGIYKKNFPEQYANKGYEKRINSNILQFFEQSKNTKSFVKNAAPIAEELFDVISEGDIINRFKKKEIAKTLKGIYSKYDINLNQKDSDINEVFRNIVDWVKESHLRYKISKSSTAKQPTSIYITLTNKKKVRISDHKSLTAHVDCDEEIIYDVNMTIEDIKIEWARVIEKLT